MEFTFRRARFVRRQRRVVAIERRAIRAHVLDVLAHVAEDMRVVLRWQCTHAHEFLSADLDDLNAKVVMEMRNDFVGHVVGTPWQRLERLARQALWESPLHLVLSKFVGIFMGMVLDMFCENSIDITGARRDPARCRGLHYFQAEPRRHRSGLLCHLRTAAGRALDNSTKMKKSQKPIADTAAAT